MALSSTDYETLREQYRPDLVRLLLIGESAPDPAGGELRFFYAPKLARADNLFRGVIKALYDVGLAGQTGASKIPLLQRLQADGVFLIDVAPTPVNHLAPAKRAAVLKSHAPEAVGKAAAFAPTGIVVCHGPTFRVVRPLLNAAELPLLHTEAIPFPLGNWRSAFVERVRAAVAGMGWTPWSS